MNAAQEKPPAPVRSAVPGPDIIDREPLRLEEHLRLRDAVPLVFDRGVWGAPVIDARGDYLGTFSLRSFLACALPVIVDDAPQPRPLLLPAGSRRFEAALARPVRDVLDLEVPVVRLSTALPQLLVALCRRSPIIPILADSGMRLLGVASIERAARALSAL